MKYNSGSPENRDLQNQFAAYVKTAVMRKRSSYLKKMWQLEKREIICEDKLLEVQEEEDFFSCFPLMDQIENEKLAKVFKSLSQKNRRILWLRAIEGLSYQEIADRLHMNFWSVKAAYLRMVHMFRKTL